MTATLSSPSLLQRKASFLNGGAEYLGIHRGAIDTTTITTKPPPIVMEGVRKVLLELGLQVQEESRYNYRCIRASRKAESDDSGSVVYGPPTEDPGDEVRLSVELTRLEGLNDTYSLDIRRLRGNLRSYKFLYETIRE
ncbi:CAMK/CAMKL/Kin4 protein kinase [Coprinopsis cinerea AmutBmut pab1-1]|nr:CAMK/CAMKL/Kin4 protein kinase [Coprinopsis cinerea AmutBmut pab1-1]